MVVHGGCDKAVLALCVESSHSRGMGHLYRALNLADAFKAVGAPCTFLLNQHEPSRAIVAERGYASSVVDLDDQDSGWEVDQVRQKRISVWINDRLDTGASHAQRVKSLGLRLVTFDDRGAGAHWADLHVAALAGDDQEILSGARVLRGVRFLILDSSIAKYRRLRQATGNIVVSMGGSDTYGVTIKVMRALAALDRGATIVIGPAFAHHDALAKAMTPQFRLKRGVPSLAEEFSHYDLAITGGGITPFEANAAGLPCIVVANEPFEIPVGKALERMGGAVFAGFHEDIDVSHFARELPIAEMSRAAMENIDLNGSRRVVHAIMSQTDPA